MTKTREELNKEYQKSIKNIWTKYHLQPSITLEYIYMKQDNEKEAREMLTLEVQRTLLYNHNLSYSNYSDTVENTIQQIIGEFQ